MDKKQNNSAANLRDMLDMKIVIPGFTCLALLVLAGALFPTQFNDALNASLVWIMDRFKFLYVLVTILIVGFSGFLLFSRFGNIRLGGKNAKPSIKTTTWCTLSLTGTIAVGICFYGVSGPVGMFMDPPEFLGVVGGTAEAIIPVLEMCFLHYGLPSYLLIVFFAMIVALVHYNGNEALKGSSALYPLLGKISRGWGGRWANILMVIALFVCGTNMGLAVIQLNAGIGTVAGMATTPSYEPYIVIFYTVLTVIFACSGVHKLMGTLSNINAICYFTILAYVLLVGPTNQLFGLLFTASGEFAMDFIPLITFSDPILQTGWQETNTMFYYSWNIFPALIGGFFYVSIAYGRTLRQFLLVNCILPCIMVFTWYTAFGGTAMLGILDGSGLYEQIQQYGDGIATFAFLEMLPFGSVLKWLFLILAIMTFVTFSDSVAYSFPLLLLKDTETDPSKTQIPKAMNAAVAIFMGILTFILLYVGGYDALSTAMIVLAFPTVIFTLMVFVSGVKFLCNRKKYDATYEEGDI